MAMSFALSERSVYLVRSYRLSKTVISVDPDQVSDTLFAHVPERHGFSHVPTR